MGYFGDYAGLEARTMTEIVRRFPAQTHIGQALLPVRPSATKQVYWDIVEGSRKKGKFSAPGAEAHNSALMPRKRVNTEVLYIKEKKVIDEQTKNFISAPGTFDAKYGDQLITDELNDLNTIVENTKEWMVWQAIVNGVIHIDQTDPAIKVNVDYAFDASHKPAATAVWADTANAKPLKDILAWKLLVARDSLVSANKAFCNSAVMAQLVENTQIQTLLQYTVGNQLAENGFITKLGGLDITVYDSSFAEDDGSVGYFLPDNKFVVLASQGLGKAFQGPIDVPAGDTAKTEIGKVSYSWVTKDPVDTWILVGDSYMPAIQNVDQIVSANI